MTKDWQICKKNEDPKYPEVFDAIIIGAGPGGMTAAIYGARRKMKILLICGHVGGQMNDCSNIENWTGVAHSTGKSLRDQFFAHVKTVDEDNDHFDLWVREEEKVKKINKANNIFTVSTDKNVSFHSKTLICTTGKIPRLLGIKGENIALAGNGLSLSATSDAPLYRNKKVVIIGGGNSAMDVSIQLLGYSQDITILTNADALQGEGCLKEKVLSNPNIKVVYEVETQEILLNKNSKVSGVTFKDKSGQLQKIECEGIFEEIGQVPATSFLKGFVELNEKDEVIVDRNLNTSVEGFFAAGDCNDGLYKQVIVASGEGAIASLEAFKYLINHH